MCQSRSPAEEDADSEPSTHQVAQPSAQINRCHSPIHTRNLMKFVRKMRNVLKVKQKRICDLPVGVELPVYENQIGGRELRNHQLSHCTRHVPKSGRSTLHNATRIFVAITVLPKCKVNENCGIMLPKIKIYFVSQRWIDDIRLYFLRPPTENVPNARLSRSTMIHLYINDPVRRSHMHLHNLSQFYV